MADGTYERGYALQDEWETFDVRMLILNDGGTPTFNVKHTSLAAVLAESGNVEEPNTRNKAVPGRTTIAGPLDHGDVVYTQPAAANWLVAVYYVPGAFDDDSPVLFYKDCVVSPTGTGDVTISTSASGLVTISHADRTLIRTVDKNRPYDTRIHYADLNNWESTHQALVLS